MSLTTTIVSLSILWRCATALPAGPGFFPNGTSPLVSSSDDFHISSSYNLIDTYDASNWISKFDVQNVSNAMSKIHSKTDIS
jgi:hypothetical protein